MNTSLKVARYHLMDRTLLWLPIAITVFVFLVNLVIFAVVPTPKDGGYTGAISALYCWLMIVGVVMIAQRLPFGLTLGLSRRAFYRGTAFVALATSAVYAAGVTVAQAIERAGDGWGVQMHFFRVPWLFEGSWYDTLVTGFVLGAAVMMYGMWYGIVYRRWGVIGMVEFVGAQLLVLTFGALATTWTHAWHDIGSFFTTISAVGFAGVLAAVTVALGVGGYATLRRVAV